MRMSRQAYGFTLIELMITAAIIAILAAIAYPSYQETIARSRRSEAKAVLLEASQWIERQYTISNNYSANNLPTMYQEAPKDGSAKSYTISFSASSPTAFTLQAVPKNGMSGDKCGTFTLTNTGGKGLSGATATQAFCWER